MDEPRASAAPPQMATRAIAVRQASTEIGIKEFAILEWLWVTYVVFCLLFYWLLYWHHGFFVMVAFYVVEFPISMWVGGWQFEELVPRWMRIYFAFLTAAANGGVYYVLARLVFRPWRLKRGRGVKG